MDMKTGAAFAVLAALLAPAAGALQETTWAEAPSVADVAAAYSAKSRAAGVQTKARISATLPSITDTTTYVAAG